ncbi:hypothetical protein NP233_g1805 [Leucocoprinus birnbaumii]|uniref:Protein kinase domain-containing protein n=1 Tax=Leucocoprinus birnbaumii TaxID=56174 RepID=A0AAD5YZ92_9AGAR|nr:hypothetical protein NP233_g1805 [Leucocoprinus birnbaumii]
MEDLDGSVTTIATKDIRLGKSIGMGGFSDVLMGEWMGPDETVAVKILRKSRNEDNPKSLQTLRKRLNREVASWRRALNVPHPNVLPFLGLYTHEADRFPALVSPLREAGDILYYLNSRESSPDRRRLAIDIASGLCHLHAHDVVHGDFTPKNILIHIEHGKVIPQIGDFGRAKILDMAGFTGSLMFNSRKQEPDADDYAANNCPVKGKAWALLHRCWRIGYPPTERCSADDFLLALDEHFCGVIRQPSQDELEEAMSSPLVEGATSDPVVEETMSNPIVEEVMSSPLEDFDLSLYDSDSSFSCD